MSADKYGIQHTGFFVELFATESASTTQNSVNVTTRYATEPSETRYMYEYLHIFVYVHT
jgi:hypothetical protein